MFIYNITFIVEKEIEKDWLDYTKNIFVPDILKNKTIRSAITSKVLVENQPDSSYSIQFSVDNQQQIDQFINHELPKNLHKINEIFSPRMVFFATRLNIVDKQ